jgi:hypothetical protein
VQLVGERTMWLGSVRVVTEITRKRGSRRGASVVPPRGRSLWPRSRVVVERPWLRTAKICACRVGYARGAPKKTRRIVIFAKPHALLGRFGECSTPIQAVSCTSVPLLSLVCTCRVRICRSLECLL